MLAAFVLAANAQSTAKVYVEKAMGPSVWSFSINNAGQADSLGLYQDSISIPIYINQPDTVKAFYRVKLTEITSPARVIVQHQSKKHKNADYTTRTTITYTGQGSDSTMYFKSQAPNLSDPYQRLLLIRVNNKAYVNDASGWFLK